MLELQKLYNHLEYEYNEDLDYIDEIYLFLHIKYNKITQTDMERSKMQSFFYAIRFYN